VDLGDEGARRVDGLEPAVGRALHDGRRDAVRAEDDMGTLGDLVDLLHEDRAHALERRDDVHVVDDLLPHVDGGAVALEGLLDGDDSAVDAGAVAPRCGEEDLLGSAHRVILEPVADAGHPRHRQADDGCSHESLVSGRCSHVFKCMRRIWASSGVDG
jgi:hypothetical protein